MTSTTIQVRKTTLQRLESLKSRYHLKSFDQVLQKLLHKEAKVPESMFGAHPKIKSFKRKEEDFHEL